MVSISSERRNLCFLSSFTTDCQFIISMEFSTCFIQELKLFGTNLNIYNLYSESKGMTITIAHFTTISGHFSANCMFIFHKKEVQTVILRCLTGLNHNQYKSYDTKPKNAKNANLCFCTKSQKNVNGNICVLLHLRP